MKNNTQIIKVDIGKNLLTAMEMIINKCPENRASFVVQEAFKINLNLSDVYNGSQKGDLWIK